MKQDQQSYSDPTPREWIVDDLCYAGLEWGAGGATKVLALHGWMDHAGSFQELAPKLTGCHVIAIDLSGQGKSGHRAAHATYNIWDDLPQIVALLDQLGWDRCVLLGHSRGAIISSLFAAAMPERVQGIIALDALVPDPVAEDSFVPTLRAFVQQTRKQLSRQPRRFASKDDYITRRSEQGNSVRTASVLSDRAIDELSDGVQMRGDARLFASSAVKLTMFQAEEVMRAIQAPVLTLWAKGGIKSKRAKTQEMADRARVLMHDLTMIDLPGDHHFHLDPATVQPIAETIMWFVEEKGFSEQP